MQTKIEQFEAMAVKWNELTANFGIEFVPLAKELLDACDNNNPYLNAELLSRLHVAAKSMDNANNKKYDDVRYGFMRIIYTAVKLLNRKEGAYAQPAKPKPEAKAKTANTNSVAAALGSLSAADMATLLAKFGKK